LGRGEGPSRFNTQTEAGGKRQEDTVGKKYWVLILGGGSHNNRERKGKEGDISRTQKINENIWGTKGKTQR